jgi:hypothetical protein
MALAESASHNPPAHIQLRVRLSTLDEQIDTVYAERDWRDISGIETSRRVAWLRIKKGLAVLRHPIAAKRIADENETNRLFNNRKRRRRDVLHHTMMGRHRPDRAVRIIKTIDKDIDGYNAKLRKS